MLCLQLLKIMDPNKTPILYLCRTPLHAAAFTDHVECLQLLLSHTAQVNCVDAAGKTPLMMAAENGQTNAVGMNVFVSFFFFFLVLTVKRLELACYNHFPIGLL